MSYQRLLDRQKSLQEELVQIQSATIELMCIENNDDNFLLGMQRQDLIEEMENQLKKINELIITIQLASLIDDEKKGG
ncbi:hypothetical protein IIC38_11695 [candidate division KSB1 bacterium]|nr:hypothetical protein [candidate division KSB1 bacterium]